MSLTRGGRPRSLPRQRCRNFGLRLPRKGASHTFLRRCRPLSCWPLWCWRARSVLPVCALLALLLWGWASGAHAQVTGDASTPLLGGDPSQDILIEGIGFSKLNLALDIAQADNDPPAYAALLPFLEKNLCWSGVFNLTGGATRFCALKGDAQRVDMRLALSWQETRLRLRLKDAGPEQAVLFEDALPLAVAQTVSQSETPVMDLVNRLTERVTGQPGLLGSTLVFTLRQPGYAKVIVATSTQGRALQLISGNKDINLLPRWSPAGSALVYTVLSTEGSAVYFHNLEPKTDGLGASRFLTESGSLNSGGAFSPDGKSLVFTMSPQQNADLFQYNLITNRATQITSRIGIETQADWAPDGTKMLFVSDRSGSPQIYLLDLKTNEDLRLTFDGPYNLDPRFSPDGRLVLFTKRVGENDQVYIMDINGENIRPLTRTRFDAEEADWSPDGRQIVFISNRTGEFKLYIVSTDGSSLRRLTATPAGFEEGSPSWTRRRLFR